jgi:hypothetical protein
MAGVSDNLSVISKFMSSLSWRKIAQLSVLVFILLLALVIYELRESIHDLAIQPRITKHAPAIQKLSKMSMDEIDTIVEKSELISGIRIVVVDFQKNTRHVIYRAIKDRALVAIYAKDGATNGPSQEIPLFDNDVANNKRLVELINGDFVCTPYAESIAAILRPATIPFSTTVCANGIPPFYGIFSGTVSVALKRPPTAFEINQLRELTRNLALVIYERDFK